MKPAFSSTRQAASFAVLLAFILALPWLMAQTGLLHRRDVYPTVAWKYGEFPWIQKKIFEEKGDVDMAFAGSSHIFCDVDTPYVQRKLSEQLGRKAEVFTLGWFWPGFDALYFIIRDLLEHRRVKTLVIYEEINDNKPHLHSSRWLRYGEGDDALEGLSSEQRTMCYGGSLLGMPRHLLTLIRPNLIANESQWTSSFLNTYYHAPNVSEHLGALRVRLAYKISPDFVRYHPVGEASPDDAVIHDAQTRGNYEFNGPPVPELQLHFIKKLALLCQEHGTQLVVLNTPQMAKCGQTAVSECLDWPAITGTNVSMIGIPPARLFAGLSNADLFKLFWDESHLNENGQDFFTRLITPALIKLHTEGLDHE